MSTDAIANTQEPEPSEESSFALVDTDVHVAFRRSLHDLVPFMPTAWRQRFEVKGLNLDIGSLTYRFANIHANGGLRPEANPPGGGVAGSDPDHLIEDLIERFGIDCAILNAQEILGLASCQAGPDEAPVLCRAYNDWMLDFWMPRDERFRFGIAVSAMEPIAAAEEIRRLGHEPRAVAIYMPTAWTGMGNRMLGPIYDAAQEVGLPIAVHPITEFMYPGTASSIVGYPENYCEFYSNLPMVAWGHLSSLVFGATFERFPELKVLFVEFGFSHIPAAMWRIDKAWESNRFEVPWIKTRPSETIREHVRFTTQPVDEPLDKRQLANVIEALGEQMLCFSTDYPHWDGDEPGQVFQKLPSDLQRRIFSGNASEFFPLARGRG